MLYHRSQWAAKYLAFFILIFICPVTATAKSAGVAASREQLPAWWNELEPQWKTFFLDILKREKTRKHKVRSVETLPLLTQLDTLPEGIDDLEGLRHLTNLSSITYYYSKKNHSLKSLKGIEKLSRLRSVSIVNALINDFSILSGAENLRFLNLSRCEITSIACVKLPRLHQLELDGNKISDITNIACYISLKSLNVSRCPISELTGIDHLKKLKRLFLSQCALTSLPCLNLPALEELNLSETHIADVKNISGCTRLTRLSLFGCTRLTDISGLAGMDRLRYLSLRHSGVRDLSALASLAGLAGLDISSNDVNLSYIAEHPDDIYSWQRWSDSIDIGPLGGLHNLRVLDMSNNNIKGGCGAFNSLSKLTILIASQVSTPAEMPFGNLFSHIGKLKNLTYLDLTAADSLFDLKDFRELKELKILIVESNDLKSLEGAEQLNNLIYLNCNYCQDLKDLTSILQLKKLKKGSVCIKDIGIPGPEYDDFRREYSCERFPPEKF